ncbi:MAG: hypothetical protein JWP11_3712 [Frankiales bacterium]|nr:hypothetical protein [Frankiales bacterium]
MTTASLKPTIPAGAILTQHVKADFDDYVAGRPRLQRLCVWRGQVGDIGIKDLDKGRAESAKYSTIDMAEVTDPRDIDLIQRIFLRSRAEGAWAASQPTLFDASEEEQRDSLLNLIKDWASEHDLAMTEVDKQFVDMFGGSEHASAETVQACRSVQQLKEFAYTVGVLPDPVVGTAADAEDAGEAREPDEDFGETTAAPPSAVAAPPFETGQDPT